MDENEQLGVVDDGEIPDDRSNVDPKEIASNDSKSNQVKYDTK